MFWRTALAASLLGWRAHAGIAGLMAEGYLARRSSADFERMMELAVDNSPLAQEYPQVLSKRQKETTSGVVLNPDGTINMTAWEQLANSACNDALTKLPESSNPSGTCICYNLPALDKDTGAFEADLRLYSLSTPSGDFAGIPPEKIMVGLSYVGASVSPVKPETAQKLVATRQEPKPESGTSQGLKLLQTYLFVGQIDKGQMASTMSSAQLEALLLPVLTLTAVNSTGQTIATNVSSNEAAFVAGVFSKEVFMSDFAVASAAVDNVVSRLTNFTEGDPNQIAFVLPGVQIMIFPIGLVITSIWLITGAAVVGWGTYERASYRKQFRRRTLEVGR